MESPVVIAGWLKVDPAGRAAYLDESRAVVEQARSAPGCVDFSLTADMLDDARINVFEHWTSEAELMAFRGSGPSAEQQVQIVDADVRQFEIASHRPA